MADPFAELSSLIGRLEGLAAATTDIVSAKLEPALQQVLEREYDQGQSPDGETWAPKADGSPSHLQKTGAMRSGTKAVNGVSGVSVHIPKPGNWHQSGTKRMPARKLVPETEPLPPEWQKALENAATEAVLGRLDK